MPALEEYLQDQVAFLDESCQAYDRGATREAYRLATTVRVLVHDTSRSHSLLSQMGVKDEITYIDGRLPGFENLPPLADNMVTSSPGLAELAHFSLAQGSSRDASEYWPTFRAASPSDLLSKPRVQFETWWKKAVSKDTVGHELFRRHYVLAAANKDGGAHIDAAFGQDFEGYRAMTRDGSMGMKASGSFVVAGPTGVPDAAGLSPAPAVIRQIAEELRVSLRLQLAGALGDLAEAPPQVEVERPVMFTGGSQWGAPPGYTLRLGPQ